MLVKILGTGCPNCLKLEKVVREVIADLHLEAIVEKVTKIDEIMDYGVMMTPALVVNEDVVLIGKIPAKKKLEKILTNKL